MYVARLSSIYEVIDSSLSKRREYSFIAKVKLSRMQYYRACNRENKRHNQREVIILRKYRAFCLLLRLGPDIKE
jgi:hypothetical protein